MRHRSPLTFASLRLPLALLLAGPCVLALAHSWETPVVKQSLCAIRHTTPEMAACVLDATCRSMLACMASCDDPSSERRVRSFEQNQHLQHPHSPVPCTVSCMDDYDGSAVDEFLTAFMSHDCAPASPVVDTYVPVEAVRPFSDDPSQFDMSWLEGEWYSVRTGGWDHWDCQKKLFFPPKDNPPKSPWYSTFWATYRTYPKSRGGKPKDNYVYEEIYPNTEPKGPTFRTRFDLWGTESREEWHVFAFDKGDPAKDEPAWVIAEVVIDTPSIEHRDVFTIVLAKTAHPSPALSDHIDRIVLDEIGFPLARVNNDRCDEHPRYERKR